MVYEIHFMNILVLVKKKGGGSSEFVFVCEGGGGVPFSFTDVFKKGQKIRSYTRYYISSIIYYEKLI